MPAAANGRPQPRRCARLRITGRKAHRLERVAEGLRAAGADFRTCVSDVADRDASRRLADATLEAFGAIDGLVGTSSAASP
ncbi:MAG: hypothetical protein R3F21_25990 [Myxococcota bacterium]